MGNLKRIVETYTVRPEEFHKQVINEGINSNSIRMIEGEDGQSYKALAVYTFPISRPDEENLNGRIYTSKLWEKVIKEKQADGCFGLMDHPEDDGSTKNCWCVWRNLRFSDDRKLILADAYLFGFWGKQVLEALEAGGSIGLSTSGFGEFEDDNKTLNPKTYLLERVADHVLNPSYSVFGHQEDLKSDVGVNESVLKTAEAWIPVDHSAEIAANFNKYKNDYGKDYDVYVAKMKSDLDVYGKHTDKVWGEWDQPVFKYFDRAKTEKCHLPKNLELVVVDKPLKDGAYLSWYADSWVYVNRNDYTDLMDNIIILKKENETLENSPKSNKEIVMENNKTTVSPSIEEKSLLLNIKSMFKEAKQVSNIFERLDNYSSLLAYFTENMSESSKNMKADIDKAIAEDNELIKTQVEAYPALEEKATSFEAKVTELEKQLAEVTEKLTASETALKEAEDKLTIVTNENADLEKKFNESCDMLDNFKTYATKQKEIVKTLEAEKNGMISPKDYKEAIVYSQSLEEELKKVKNELHEAKKAKKEDDDEPENDEPKDGEDDGEGDSDSKDSEDDDDLEKVDDKKKKESFVNEDIEEYYNDLLDRNPKVTLIKEDIMKCRTLLEAQMTYLRLKGLVEESSIGYSDRAIKAQTKLANEEEKSVKHAALRQGWL